MSESASTLTPKLSMGAQDHMTCGCSHSGFLRKQGQLERMFSFKRWRQRFLIVSRGCLYVFKTETSTSPLRVYCLVDYTRLERHRVGDHRWTFRALPFDPSKQKIPLFDCTNDHDRKEWMAAIKKEMLHAHDSQAASDDEDWGDYIYLEADVHSTTHKKVTSAVAEPGFESDEDYNTIDDLHQDVSVPASPGSNSDGSSYNQVQWNNHTPKKPTFKAPAPQPSQSYTPVKKEFKVAKKKTLPTTPGKSVSKTPNHPKTRDNANDKNFLRPNYEFNGSDRNDVSVILISKPEGTFLVRQSRSDDREVLSLNVGGELKEFKIYLQNGQFSIDTKQTFHSVENLLRHYSRSCLPGHPVTLKQPYSLAVNG